VKSKKRDNHMKLLSFKKSLLIAVILAGLIGDPIDVFAEQKVQDWELINPEGVVKIETMKLTPHPSRLEGKTIMLRSNGKHNGDKFLIRVGELLKDKVKDIKIIYSWEVAPETVDPITGNHERSKRFAQKLASFKPDLVIASQAD